MRRGLVFCVAVIFLISLSFGFVGAAEDGGDELRCLPCGDNCYSSEDIAAIYCNPPTGEVDCGVENGECAVLNFVPFEDEASPELGECIEKCELNYDNEEERRKCIGGCESDFGPKDDPNYRCEDMTQEHCDNAEDCESIWGGPSFCEGDTCTSDTTWEGCRYKYEDTFKELDEEFEDEEVDPGMTPDSPFYFLDGLFGDSREEKIAEVEAMIEKGDLESARKALLKYMEQAKKLSDNPDPEKREEARRAAAAIHKMLEKIKENLSEEDKKEFYDDILDSEGGIITSVEISSKIKELCEQLSELDPVEYSKMCRAGDDAPRWQKDLDRDLSEEQKKIAKNFVSIMKKCFKTSGQDCKCEEIPFNDFADACSEAASLASACDIEKDEAACEELDNLEMPELPEWLEPIWEDLEDGMNEAQYDMHMPEECVDAGVTSPKECGKIMIETNSPPECKQALLDSGCEAEFECRKICDKIMMEKHALDCAEKGITDPKECARFMDSFRGEDNRMDRGPRIDFDCKKIENAEKRLECYDKATSQANSYGGGFDDPNYEGPCMTDSDWKAKKIECREKFGEHAGDEPVKGDSGDGYQCVIDAKCIDFGQKFEETKEEERECASSCERENKAWSFYGGNCQCFEGGGGDYGSGSGYSGDYEQGGDYEGGPSCDDCASQCPGASGTGCGPNGCECYYDDNEPQYGPGEGPGEPGEFDNNGEPPSSGGGDGGGEGGSDDGGSDGGDDGGSDGGNLITGEVFLDYYYD